LEYLEKIGKPLKKSEVDWSQTRVMFIGPKFTTYQKRALSPNLPFELWEVNLYEGGLIEYDEITPLGSEKKLDKKSITLTGTAAKEIKTYTVDDHLKNASQETKEMFQKLREQILLLDSNIKEKAVSWYIGYQLKGYNIAFVQVYTKDKLMVNVAVEKPIDPEKRLQIAPKSWQGWNKIPLARFSLTKEKDITYIMRIINQSYEYRKG
jgi:predicted transport protein